MKSNPKSVLFERLCYISNILKWFSKSFLAYAAYIRVPIPTVKPNACHCARYRSVCLSFHLLLFSSFGADKTGRSHCRNEIHALLKYLKHDQNHVVNDGFRWGRAEFPLLDILARPDFYGRVRSQC